MIKKKIITNCLTCGVDIQHKHKGAKYCSYDCYWKSTDSELKKKQKSAAKSIIKFNSENGVWNVGLNKENSDLYKKMSEDRRGDNNPFNIAINEGRSEVYLKGKTYDEYFGKTKSEKIKNKIRNSTLNQYKKGNTSKVNTKPEREFKKILKDNNIKYIQSFYLDRKIYDFYIPTKNVLIEIDGIYWHGKGIDLENLNETQLRNKKNDTIKNKIAMDNGYDLIRIWEDEINNFDINKIL